MNSFTWLLWADGGITADACARNSLAFCEQTCYCIWANIGGSLTIATLCNSTGSRFHKHPKITSPPDPGATIKTFFVIRCLGSPRVRGFRDNGHAKGSIFSCYGIPICQHDLLDLVNLCIQFRLRVCFLVFTEVLNIRLPVKPNRSWAIQYIPHPK